VFIHRLDLIVGGAIGVCSVGVGNAMPNTGGAGVIALPLLGDGAVQFGWRVLHRKVQKFNKRAV